GLVRRLRAPVLPDLPDRRQAPRRPPPLPPAQVDPLSRPAGGARGHDRSPTAAAPAGTLRRNLGAIAQLEEHLLCKQGVSGSSPLSSTGQRPGLAPQRVAGSQTGSQSITLMAWVDAVLVTMPSTSTTPATAETRGFTRAAPAGGAARCRSATAPTASGSAAKCPVRPSRPSRTSSGSCTVTSRPASGRPPPGTPSARPSRTG